MTDPSHITIVGGGLTGLSAAFYLHREIQERNLPITITLLEASERVGGKIQTTHTHGFTIEGGPDSWLERKGYATQLAIDLGLEKDLVNNSVGQSYILRQDRLYPIPSGSVMGIPTKWQAVLESELVSEKGKKRAGAELFRSVRSSKSDQSVRNFFQDRFGREWVDQVMEPLLSGVYGNDIEQLSLRSTFPQYEGLLEQYGSLITAMRQTRTKSAGTVTSKGMFQTLRSGLESLVHQLEDVLPTGLIQKNAAVDSVIRTAGHYRIFLQDGRAFDTDQILFTTSHPVTQKVLGRYIELPSLQHASPSSVATVALGFDTKNVQIELPGTGFVIPRKEGYRITACTWLHKKWPHTTPEGKVLLRCFVGRSGDDLLASRSEDEIIQIALEELARVQSLQINGEPEIAVVEKLLNSRPPYEVGHQEWLQDTRNRLSNVLPDIYLAGSFYEGIGLPDCIQQGKKAVSEIIESLCLKVLH
ncbi:protoporphyrinogen oxidase [Risungbinella massiliensis]|uniref:protoporphyrinogen oxidase n=1 Tax=Risungbinella massiliensis TaxID=1329796 RepID=UPI0005CB8F17|nr:protoporphyrinogen oxidase [Risungbinella massiliensis]